MEWIIMMTRLLKQMIQLPKKQVLIFGQSTRKTRHFTIVRESEVQLCVMVITSASASASLKWSSSGTWDNGLGQRLGTAGYTPKETSGPHFWAKHTKIALICENQHMCDGSYISISIIVSISISTSISINIKFNFSISIII